MTSHPVRLQRGTFVYSKLSATGTAALTNFILKEPSSAAKFDGFVLAISCEYESEFEIGKDETKIVMRGKDSFEIPYSQGMIEVHQSKLTKSGVERLLSATEIDTLERVALPPAGALPKPDAGTPINRFSIHTFGSEAVFEAMSNRCPTPK